MLYPRLIGIVLMGGKSQRMGRDKGHLLYYDQMQFRRLLEMLNQVCDQTVISCNPDQSVTLSEFTSVVDHYPERGPMGGVISAMEVFPNAALLTVPCDLPFLNVSALQLLISKRDPGKMATTSWNRNLDKLEPLLTIWEPASIPVVFDRFKRNELSIYRCLQEIDSAIVSALDPGIFRNVNTPADYDQVCREISAGESHQNEAFLE